MHSDTRDTRSDPRLDGLRASIDVRDLARRDFSYEERFDNVWVKDYAHLYNGSDGPVRIGYRFREDLFAAAFARVCYHDGEEVPARGKSGYCIKLVMLATSGRAAGEACVPLLAHAMADLDDEALIIAESPGNETTRILEALQFVRLGANGTNLVRYAFSFSAQARVLPEDHLSIESGEKVLANLIDEEQRYYECLEASTGFSIMHLVLDGWTTYRKNGTTFLLVLTHGHSAKFHQTVMKYDLYDTINGMHVAYNDIFVSTDCDCAINDLPATEVSSDLPVTLPVDLREKCRYGLGQANMVRRVWRSFDGIWVRTEYRRAGIGHSLVRIAGDVCKLTYPHITAIQVRGNFDNPLSFKFHRKNGAQNVRNKLYNLEYPLYEERRPDIIILYGT